MTSKSHWNYFGFNLWLMIHWAWEICLRFTVKQSTPIQSGCVDAQYWWRRGHLESPKSSSSFNKSSMRLRLQTITFLRLEQLNSLFSCSLFFCSTNRDLNAFAIDKRRSQCLTPSNLARRTSLERHKFRPFTHTSGQSRGLKKIRHTCWNTEPLLGHCRIPGLCFLPALKKRS